MRSVEDTFWPVRSAPSGPLMLLKLERSQTILRCLAHFAMPDLTVYTCLRLHCAYGVGLGGQVV